jgi:hypothetical protein
LNAIEIEQAISELAEQAFDAEEFPFQFLEAFGNKATTIKRLRSGNSNKSDVEGAVLQRSNIHLSVAPVGEVASTLKALRESPQTEKQKAKIILATDGEDLEAEDLSLGEIVACSYKDFPNHFGFFLPLAGISTVREIRENPIDIQATSRLNRLYVELLKENPDWDTDKRRQDMNQLMARLIFCFFAEDTNIFKGDNLFTSTIEQMSDSRSGNITEVISELFRAMDISYSDRPAAKLPRWAEAFPYVNGGLFAGNQEVPKFTRIARSYLLHAGNLNWKEINPDIFGSMIQAVADDEERGALGMHYTSVPNILKVLNPLFLDDLREKLEEAGANARKLLNLRNRISKIRVFDPACGSGNFLVIAYKEMRAVEFEINQRRDETHLKSDIPLTNFRGIEIREFPAEVARLALIIAEYQCDERYLGQKQALAEFLPLESQNWIICGNALRLDWLAVCPPTGSPTKQVAEDLFETPLEQPEIDFENEGGETYICSNPPYLGSSFQSKPQKSDLEILFTKRIKNWKNLDYIAGWFLKSSDYLKNAGQTFALVSTNSICQGQQVALLWPLIAENNQEIVFAHESFRWANLAAHKAAVMVIVAGISHRRSGKKKLYQENERGEPLVSSVTNINSYLIPAGNIIVQPRNTPLGDRNNMLKGNMPTDGGHLCLTPSEVRSLIASSPGAASYIYKYIGSGDLIKGEERYCIWVTDEQSHHASKFPEFASRFEKVAEMRAVSSAPTTRPYAAYPYKFRQIQAVAQDFALVAPRVSSERRRFLPVGLTTGNSIISDSAFALYDAPLWNMALIASRIHLIWIATVCGKLKTDFRYSNTLGWNTFPIPTLTEKNKSDLTRCAEDILLAREAHFPKTIADLYDPEKMPENLRRVHDQNDEVLERIYIGRRFKNDTERLEKLFELYTKITSPETAKEAS